MIVTRPTYNATIGGHELADYGVVLAKDGFRVGQAEPVLTFTEIAGMYGSHDLTLDDVTDAAFVLRRDIELDVIACDDGMPTDPTCVPASKALVGALNGSDTTIGWRPYGGEFRGRLTVGQWEDRRDARGVLAASQCTLTLHAMPFVYGPAVTQALGSGSTTLQVGGNRPTRPVFRITPSSSSAWSVGIGDATIQRETSTGGTQPVTIDCGRRRTYLTTTGTNLVITLASEYPTLVPGSNTVRLTGCTGSVWYEPVTLI